MSTVIDRTRRRGQSALRVPFDFYATPPEAVRALLSVETFDGPIWEPACGDGAISAVLKAAGHSVISTDVVNRGYGEPGVDFLLEPHPRAKHIITNPPYGGGLADAFIGKALTLVRATGGKIAMLLDLSSLCHPRRHAKWVRTPPATIYPLDALVCLPDGDAGRAPFMARAERRYMWAIWKAGHGGPTELRWLSASAFRSSR